MVRKEKLVHTPHFTAVAEEYSFEPGDTDFDLRVLRALRRIMRAVDVYSRKLIAGYGITGPQLVCLSHIVKGGGITLSRLSRGMYMSPSTVNGILDRLEVKRLIQRERKDRDRRKVIVTATNEGKKVIAHAPSSLQDKLASAMQRLPEREQIALTTSIERIVDLMEIGYLDSSPILVKELKPAEEKGRR
jgi:DNA-binding MarR family transcriptional regulator